MRMLRRIKGVTLRDKVKSVDTRKGLGMNSIHEKVREMRLCWTHAENGRKQQNDSSY